MLWFATVWEPKKGSPKLSSSYSPVHGPSTSVCLSWGLLHSADSQLTFQMLAQLPGEASYKLFTLSWDCLWNHKYRNRLRRNGKVVFWRLETLTTSILNDCSTKGQDTLTSSPQEPICPICQKQAVTSLLPQVSPAQVDSWVHLFQALSIYATSYSSSNGRGSLRGWLWRKSNQAATAPRKKKKSDTEIFILVWQKKKKKNQLGLLHTSRQEGDLTFGSSNELPKGQALLSDFRSTRGNSAYRLKNSDLCGQHCSPEWAHCHRELTQFTVPLESAMSKAHSIHPAVLGQLSMQPLY